MMGVGDMAKWHWIVASASSSVAMLGLVATSGLMVIANHFIDDLTSPNASMDEAAKLFGSWLVPNPEPEPPIELQRALSFHSRGGPLLRGDFWAQPHPAPTVVICHGYSISRARLRNVAALEYNSGFNILLFDFRGHGESEAVATSGGTAEVLDLQAAIDQAAAQPETLPGKIILHGFSMGAAIALLTPPRADVAGIIADSPYARLDEIIDRLINWRLAEASAGWRQPLSPLRRTFPAFARLLVRTSGLLFRMRFHYRLLAQPATAMRQWFAPRAKLAEAHQPIPLLLIHAIDDPLIPLDHAHQIVAAAHASHTPLEILFVATDAHCGAYGHDPQSYVDAIQRFVARYLGNDLENSRLASN